MTLLMRSAHWALFLGSAFSFAIPGSAQPWIRRATPEEARAQSDAAMAMLGPYLNQLGFAALDQREAAIAKITDRAAAEQRQSAVRAKIISLVGGIPKAEGAVDVRTFGSVDEAGFTVEKVAYQSCPDYWVTANVYVPWSAGPFPAVVITAGHGGGKENLFGWGATLARAGILVLAYDPMGQGERLQHFDPELGGSKLEWLGEHEHANQSGLLVDEPIARYWFADGMRAVDYLVQRGDVDPARIGTFGCSGGGTAAAYLAAMDPRIAVAAVSSFLTSFRALLPGNGPQDAEQTLPGFLSAGLDFADWVELAAPRPYAVVAFAGDFFPIAGAVATFDEAQKFYAHFDTGEQVQLIRGPGGHCNLRAVMPELLGFLVHHLQGPDAVVPDFADVRPADPDELTVTPTGQVATSLGGKIAEDMAREHPLRTTTVIATRADVDALRTHVHHDIHELAGTVAGAPSVPVVRRTSGRETATYRLEAIELDSEPGITLAGRLAVPRESGRHPVVIWLDALPLDKTVESPDFDRLAAAGNVVLALHPRGVLGEPDPHPERFALGQYMSPSLRAIIVGRTFVGMRVDDTRRAIAWLVSLPEVDPAHVVLFGREAQGMVALHAAALDRAITDVVIENSLLSYQLALASGLHRNLCELVIPGVLTRYDTDDLLNAISPRPVTILNPVNAMGQPVRIDQARDAWSNVLMGARELGESNRVRILRHDPRDALPIP